MSYTILAAICLALVAYAFFNLGRILTQIEYELSENDDDDFI